MLKILAKDLEEEDMKKFNEIIKTNRDKLNESTKSSDELKRVLGYVTKIVNKKASMELKLHGMAEKIHFLELNNYQELKDLKVKYEDLKREWETLRRQAKVKDKMLETRKKDLSTNTEKEAEKLAEEVKEEYNKYNKTGPSTDIELSAGYKVLLETNETLKQLKQRKDDIVESQKLFNLPITTFPEINEMIEPNQESSKKKHRKSSSSTHIPYSLILSINHQRIISQLIGFSFSQSNIIIEIWKFIVAERLNDT